MMKQLLLQYIHICYSYTMIIYICMSLNLIWQMVHIFRQAHKPMALQPLTLALQDTFQLMDHIV